MDQSNISRATTRLKIHNGGSQRLKENSIKKNTFFYFKKTKAWRHVLIAMAMTLSVFWGYIIYAPRVESSVPGRPVINSVICPIPPRPRSARPLQTLKKTILPKLTYVESRATREITAYNAGDINQCDADPCISASGENICLALDRGLKRCAANFVPLGTRLWIENVGDCLVTDRMHYRFNHRVDIAMPLTEKNKALEFGLKKLEVKIFSNM